MYTKKTKKTKKILKFLSRNPQCEIAMQVFKDCPDQVQAVKDCGGIISNNKIMKCLRDYNVDPMDAFVYCLKYLCRDDSDSCALLKEDMENCPKVPAVRSGTSCPKIGIY